MKTSIPQGAVATQKEEHACQRSGERQLLLLSGGQLQCEKLILGALAGALSGFASDSSDRLNEQVQVKGAGDQRNVCAVSAIPWVADDLPAACPQGLLQHVHVKKATQLLGGNYRCVVYVACPSFDANVFAALAGSVLGGGILILVHSFDPLTSAYEKYFSSVFNAFRARAKEPFLSLRVEDDSAVTRLQYGVTRAFEEDQSEVGESSTDFEASPAQQAFVNGTIDKLYGPKAAEVGSYCTLLKAKRGRGKTMALALLVQRLLMQSESEQLWFCAPTRRQAQPVYDFLRAHTDSKTLSVERRLRFCSVDQLLERVKKVSSGAAASHHAVDLPLVIVDEAAALSLGLLKSLAQRCFRLVMATTTEGYEGSGRGFLLRYQDYLRSIFDTLDEWQFEQPLRWSPSDQLEPFVDSVCGLNWLDSKDQSTPFSDERLVEPSLGQGQAKVSDLDVVIEKVSFAQLSEPLPDQLPELLADEQHAACQSQSPQPSLQQQIYQLLIDSHYQTRPSDLQRLYDADDHHLWVALNNRGNNQGTGASDTAPPLVCGVLLAIEEGDFDRKFDSVLAESVAQGERRPPGNLVAQKLSSHTCDNLWCRAPSLRVSRIVVAPSMQRSGLGSRMLAAMESSVSNGPVNQLQVAYWSSSFGVNEALLHFWRANGAEVAFIGSKVDKASGERTAIVVKPVVKSVTKPSTRLPEKSVVKPEATLTATSTGDRQPAKGAIDGDIERTIAFAVALTALEQARTVSLSGSETEFDADLWGASLVSLDRRRLDRLLLGRVDWDTVYPSFDRFLHFQQQASPRATLSYGKSPSVTALELAECLAQNRGDWKAAAEALHLTGRGELVEFARQCLRESGLFLVE